MAVSGWREQAEEQTGRSLEQVRQVVTEEKRQKDKSGNRNTRTTRKNSGGDLASNLPQRNEQQRGDEPVRLLSV